VKAGKDTRNLLH